MSIVKYILYGIKWVVIAALLFVVAVVSFEHGILNAFTLVMIAVSVASSWYGLVGARLLVFIVALIAVAVASSWYGIFNAFTSVMIAASAVIIMHPISRKRRYGSVSATSRPDGARVFLDGVNKGESPLTMDKIQKGTRIVLFSKSGYSDCKKEVVVNANQTTTVHCDLKKPEMKLRLSAEPAEIHANGKSKSVITISVEDENGTPAPVPEDTEIVLETNIGLIDTPVSIPAGGASATSILTSSTAGGTATVRAKSGTGLKNDIVVRFV